MSPLALCVSIGHGLLGLELDTRTFSFWIVEEQVTVAQRRCEEFRRRRVPALARETGTASTADTSTPPSLPTPRAHRCCDVYTMLRVGGGNGRRLVAPTHAAALIGSDYQEAPSADSYGTLGPRTHARGSSERMERESGTDVLDRGRWGSRRLRKPTEQQNSRTHTHTHTHAPDKTKKRAVAAPHRIEAKRRGFEATRQTHLSTLRRRGARA